MKPLEVLVWATVALVVLAATGPIIVGVLNALVLPVALIACSVALVRLAWFFTRQR